MATEIERKWLVELEKVPFDLENAEKHRIVQSYVCFNPQIRLRSLDDGTRFIMTVKPYRNEPTALSRPEFEAEITRASYEDLSVDSVGKVIEKVRYVIPEEGDTGRVWEIDVFEGAFAGLIVAEMEFASEEEALSYPDPAWVERDITYDVSYKNVVMAQS